MKEVFPLMSTTDSTSCNFKKYSFKSFDGYELDFKVYGSNAQKNFVKRRPVIIFLFGGGWSTGSFDHFQNQAMAFAEHGYIAVTPAYRIFSVHGTTIETALRDVFCFLQILGKMDVQLGIDRCNVFLSGGSAGGHLALSALLINNCMHELLIKGLVLFNPILDTSSSGFQNEAIIQQPFDPIIYSPLHHIKPNLPPTIIFQGTEDEIAKYATAEKFVATMARAGNFCELVAYKGRPHGFFNPRSSNLIEDYHDTLEKSVAFCDKTLSYT